MKEGDLRIWNIINPPNDMIVYEVDTPEAGARLIGKLANQQLQHDRIHSNVFGLDVYEDGEWRDWQDEDGETLDELKERLGL